MESSLPVLAFASLLSKLTSTPCPTLSEITAALDDTTKYPKNAPLFITWNENGSLRGCIGTFLPMSLEHGIAEYAIISATQDSRFPPIAVKDLTRLSVSVTLLTNFVTIKDCNDWKIGFHGLKVQIREDGHIYLGTFLPSVAKEQCWNQTETLWNLLYKAGYRGVSEDEAVEFYNQSLKNGTIELSRYEGLKYDLSYSDYQKLSATWEIRPM